MLNVLLFMKHRQIVFHIMNKLYEVVVMKYKIAETFVSINGEGTKAGQLAVFLRLCGCNLRCSYCDTMWANKEDVPYTEMTLDEIVAYIKETKVKNITLTGGEPLLDREGEDVVSLLKAISEIDDVSVEIETNGSVNLSKFININDNIAFTMDYKLPGSGMEHKMCHENFRYLRECDTVKFVSGSLEDLNRARQIISENDLTRKCHVYISPVFGRIQPVEIVNYMMENKMNDVNLQLQMHKVIWDPDKKGV